MASVSEGPDTFFRLSPAERAATNCFGMLRGEIKGRVDVNYWRLTPIVNHRFKNPLFPIERLGRLVTAVQYGSSSLAKSEPPGTPMLRMNNLQDDGWDLSDLKYIELNSQEIDVYRLIPGDILFNRTNSKELVGKCAVFREAGQWVFASYLIRVRANESVLLPQFASDFLATGIGRIQIDRLSRQIIGMTNINAEEIRELRIPLPPIDKQRELVTAMNAARAERHEKLAKADALQIGLNEVALRIIGIGSIPSPRKTFAIRVSDIVGVINPDRYRGLQLENGLPFANTLSVVGEMLQTRCSPENDAPEELWDCIRIDDLPNRPWQVEKLRTDHGKNLKGTFFEVRENDVLVARLGPTILNAKFVLCPPLIRRTVASPEFLVLRCNAHHNPGSVLWVLRTNLYREIMYFRSRGATPSRFRLNGDDFLSIPFPTMDAAVQNALASEADRRRDDARLLRIEAETGWQQAKSWFEEQLLGPAAA